MEHGLAGGLAGLALFLFPGLAWTLALAPGLGWPRALALSLVAAFTVAPAALFALNLLFDVPIRLATIAFLCVALGMAGISFHLAGPLLARLRE